MTNPPPRTPAEQFAAILLRLSLAVDGHSTWGRLARPLALLILGRIRGVRQRFDRLVARIAAGTYTPRRPSAGPRQKPVAPRPRPPNPLPCKFGWLLPLVPEAVQYRAQLEHLFRDPAMAALMAAAPAPMARILRTLCRMLYITSPPLLASRRPPRQPGVPPTPAPAAAPKAPKPHPPNPPPHGKKVFSTPSREDRGGGWRQGRDFRRSA